MNVGELRVILAGLPDDHLVVLASDAEGNYFDEAWLAQTCQTRDGYTSFPTDNPEWDPTQDVLNAICLWPVR